MEQDQEEYMFVRIRSRSGFWEIEQQVIWGCHTERVQYRQTESQFLIKVNLSSSCRENKKRGTWLKCPHLLLNEQLYKKSYG